MELSRGNLTHIADDRAYLYRALVLEEYRGKRILNGMDRYAMAQMRKKSKRYFVTWVPEGNHASIKARDRIGFKRIGSMEQMSFLGFKRDRISRDLLAYLQTPRAG